MIRSGVRRLGRGLKRRLKGAVKRALNPESGDDWASTPAASSRPASPTEPTEAPVSPFQAAADSPEASSPADAAAPVDASGSAEPGTDEVGPPLTRDQVQELFEDMVRPALQSDGGDIDLVKVEDNDVYVRLMGACSSCPSSTVTMKMGIERLLEEEFPQFRHLIQVA